MNRHLAACVAVAVIVGAAISACTSHADTSAGGAARSGAPGSGTSAPARPAAAPGCAAAFDPSSFVAVVNNPYYPLPVGRTLVYRGVREGVTQTDTVTVTSQKKVVDGVTTTVVTDRADHNGRVLEQTSDYFAQDRAGNVWYLGEDTKSIDADGTVDTSGSWLAGVRGATPGIIMLADPKVPCGYRQEYFKGEAEDTAWIVGRGASVTVPYGTVHDTLRSLEVTVLEANVVDEKIYAPGIGIVTERSLAGPTEVAELVKVTG
ncbi:MAG TPA: hypothetical protein VKB59_09485 [Micromonosporaceae bacterium]|nr:hypothetical protein [Micromonosporaceae bacterium]